MRQKIFYILIFIFSITSISLAGHKNIHSKEYCEELLESARKEYFARNYVKSLEILTELQLMLKESNNTELELSSLNFLGLIYIDLLAYDKSMECFLRMYELGVASNNLKAQIIALNNISIIYNENNENYEALDYLKKAYNISLKLNDSAKIGQIASSIVYTANLIKDTALVEQYINIVKNTPIEDKGSTMYINSVIVQFLLNKGDYSAAEALALEILQEEMDPRQKISLYFLLSDIYQHKGDTKKTVQYLYDILNEKPIIREKIKVYELLSQFYIENYCWCVTNRINYTEVH